MKPVRIFVEEGGDQGLWSIHLNGRLQNEFDYFFDLLNNVEYLYNFFENNKTDLMAGYFDAMTTEEAVQRTLEEIAQMEDALYNFTERGFSGKENCLQHLFKPLNNFEYAICATKKARHVLKKAG